MDTVRIGKFLLELRCERKLTQEQLGERIGVSNRTVSRWENGNYMPPVEMLLELSNFYGVSINEILSGRRLDDTEAKSAADENLKSVLEESPFSLEEKKRYFTKKVEKGALAHICDTFDHCCNCYNDIGTARSASGSRSRLFDTYSGADRVL